MKYSRDQVVSWAQRLAAGDTLTQIAADYDVTPRRIREQFYSFGLKKPSDYASGVEVPPVHGVNDPDGDWAGMREFVGPHLRRAIESLIKHGTVLQAAEEIGITPEALRARLSEARYISARRGWAPGSDMRVSQPEGFHVKGVSGYYKIDPTTGERKLTGQWIKTKKDEEHKLQQLLDAVRSLSADFEGKAKPVKKDKKTVNTDDLLAVYPMGDPHIGMFAWSEETGDDSHDLKKGEELLTTATKKLVDLAPPAKEALIVNLGDFFHADNVDNRTSRSGHALDVDSRWAKVLRVGIHTMVRCINYALAKHEKVTVICEIGNHDDHSAVVLAVALDLYFKNEPRVHIDTSPSRYHWFRFGANLLGVHHGHGSKMQDLPGIMAHDKAKDWGETTYRYWYTGHVHHQQCKEFPGVIVESFRTVAPRDAWHAGAGYRSGREMVLDVLHKKHGRIVRHIVGIEQITS